MDVSIRTAVARDLPALRALFRRLSLSNAGDRDVLLANPHALELPEGSVGAGWTRVAVSSEGDILGFATAVPLETAAAELADLFVDPDWMRRGIATRLIGRLIEEAARAGVTRIEVTANPHADAFYRSVGFVQMHETDTEFGPAVRMQLRVTRP